MHNLLGDPDQSILKTVHQKGEGYDRPREFDEIKLTLKVFQI
jgi:hypothetical protein